MLVISTIFKESQYCQRSVYRACLSLSIYVLSYFPFGFEGRMWDLIVSVPDHCLFFLLYVCNLVTYFMTLVPVRVGDSVFVLSVLLHRIKLNPKANNIV